jgi:membrane-associated protein
MNRRRFLLWSLVGAVLWVALVLLAGYFLGAAFPALGQNIDKAMLVILAFSVIPIAIEWWRNRRARGASAGRSGRSDSGDPDRQTGEDTVAGTSQDAPVDVDRG